ncbi:MAG: anti-virulence regulator CigR family protein [Deltaproteobacteria bacterium]|nr:anti-virulence regulator CigR family protein [Deltaproteobacteria bacterium]
MNIFRYAAMCMLVAFMAFAIISAPMAAAAPPQGKGNSVKGGGKGPHKGGGNEQHKGGGNEQHKGGRTGQHSGGGKGSHNYGGKGQHRGSGSDYDEVDLAAVLVTAGITALAAQDIARSNNLIGYEPLPPGIQKNLMRGKPLPPGIAKKNVSAKMLRQLPVHPGYEWRVAGRDLVLVGTATMIVADVLHDVFD